MPGNSSQPAGQTTSTVSNDPWSGVQPHLTEAFQQAGALYNQGGPQFFPSSTVTPFSTETGQGLDAITQRATQGSPLLQAGQQGLLNTIQGQGFQQNPFLDQGQNPQLQDMLRMGQDSIRNQLSGQFAQGGRFGPGAMVAEQGRALGDFTSQFLGSQYQQDQNRRFGAYEGERGRQFGAFGQAPGMAQADYADPQALLGVGAQREFKGSQQLQDAMNRFNFAQNQPAANLNQYLAQLGQGGQYGQTTTQQPFFQNQGAGLLGGGLAGGQLGMMFGGPLGAGIGAGAGALLGGFG